VNNFNVISDLCFPVFGETCPSDNNYASSSAVTKICPILHQQQGIGIQSISGIPDGKGKIRLTNQSHLRIRVRQEQISAFYKLAGKQLSIGSHSIRLGIPTLKNLKASDSLQSRIVTIKGYMEAQGFIQALHRQMDMLGIHGDASVPLLSNGDLSRKTIKIKKYSVVGFTVKIQNLSIDDSLKLQVFGLGGKRSLGCGFFMPLRG
jgi:CRISPR-associated protein Cas6